MPRNYRLARDHILQAMPGTVEELIKKSGYAQHTVWKWIRDMRKNPDPYKRESHIVGWRRPNGSGNFIAVHGAGPGKDAACQLKPLTSSQKWVKRKKTYGLEALMAQARARDWRKKIRDGVWTYKRDPLLRSFYPKGNS